MLPPAPPNRTTRFRAASNAIATSERADGPISCFCVHKSCAMETSVRFPTSPPKLFFVICKSRHAVKRFSHDPVGRQCELFTMVETAHGAVARMTGDCRIVEAIDPIAQAVRSAPLPFIACCRPFAAKACSLPPERSRFEFAQPVFQRHTGHGKRPREPEGCRSRCLVGQRPNVHSDCATFGLRLVRTFA